MAKEIGEVGDENKGNGDQQGVDDDKVGKGDKIQVFRRREEEEFLPREDFG